MSKQQLITVKEARKQMGKKSASLSDSQVEDIIGHLQTLAQIIGPIVSDKLSGASVPKSTQGDCQTRDFSQNK